MLDFVLAEGLQPLKGIEKLVDIRRLKSFTTEKKSQKKCIIYRETYEFEEGELKNLAKLGGAVFFSFSDIIKQKGFQRGITISKMRIASQMCKKTGCGAVFGTLAQNQMMLRNEKELEALMRVLGMTPHEIEFSKKLASKLIGEVK
ncbi:MAG: hypothetical protein QXT25_02115 [Candidatus Anstonellaceae archaeon]